MKRPNIKISSNEWKILKQLLAKLYSFIQWTKKFYFFHFLVAYLLPSNLLVIIAILITPIVIIYALVNNYIDSVQKLIECFLGPVSALLFFMPFLFYSAIILGLIFQVIMMLVQYIRERSILVNSNFLLNNKIYDKFYLYSIILIIISRLCLLFNMLILP